MLFISVTTSTALHAIQRESQAADSVILFTLRFASRYSLYSYRTTLTTLRDVVLF